MDRPTFLPGTRLSSESGSKPVSSACTRNLCPGLKPSRGRQSESAALARRIQSGRLKPNRNLPPFATRSQSRITSTGRIRSRYSFDAIAKQNNSYWSNQVEVQRREVAAWIAEQGGKSAGALQLAHSAAELEESMDKSAVTPGAITPAREILAELLLVEHQPKDSLAEYQSVLKIAPNRFNALYGAARAAEEAGDAVAASNYFRKLTYVAVGDERPELKTARQKLLAEEAAR